MTVTDDRGVILIEPHPDALGRSYTRGAGWFEPLETKISREGIVCDECGGHTLGQQEASRNGGRE